MKIPYTLLAWVLKSTPFPSAQKVSSVKTLYAGPSKSTYILKLLILKRLFLLRFTVGNTFEQKLELLNRIAI